MEWPSAVDLNTFLDAQMRTAGLSLQPQIIKHELIDRLLGV